MKEQELFGKEDQVYSAIATEKGIVAAEIKAVDKAIERKESERKGLEDRHQMLSNAMKIAEPKKKEKKKRVKK
jgi:hypothetical protein